MIQDSKFSTKLIVRQSAFKMVSNSPLIMICTGTGIAPFIGFLEEMENSANRENYLLFGSKNREYDFIYEETLKEYVHKGLIKHFRCIFSRDNTFISNKDSLIDEKKELNMKYVQNVIERDVQLFKELVINKNGVIYICGGVDMGKGVMKVLENIFGLNVIHSLEKEKRINKELWG